MSEKKTRNKFRDMLGDYYLTNRTISKETEEANKDRDTSRMTKNEKLYLAVIVIGLILIGIKYLL
jgi:hypothetical protein